MRTFDRWITVPGFEPVMATLYIAAGKSQKVVVIGSEIGTERSHYRHFAGFLSRIGFNVITYDNGGIGISTFDSARKNKATLAQWAKELDAVIYFGISHWNTTDICFAGHGVGAQLLTLSKRASHFRKIVLVGAQLPYYKIWPEKDHLRLYIMWHLLIPFLSAISGKLPAFVMGLGTDLPKRVALDWARWSRSPEGSLAVYRETFAKTISAPLLSLSFSDDRRAPRAACEALLYKFYHAPLEHRHISPEEIGVAEIGHFGFFREEFEEIIWRSIFRFFSGSDKTAQRTQSEFTRRMMPLLKSDFDITIYQ